jgi:hypothetical protein
MLSHQTRLSLSLSWSPVKCQLYTILYFLINFTPVRWDLPFYRRFIYDSYICPFVFCEIFSKMFKCNQKCGFTLFGDFHMSSSKQNRHILQRHFCWESFLCASNELRHFIDRWFEKTSHWCSSQVFGIFPRN